MLTKVQVIDARGRTAATLYMGNDPGMQYAIREVKGLGPVNAGIVLIDYPGDGKVAGEVTIEDRNIVFTIGYNPRVASGETIEKLRTALYANMAPGMPVTLRFYDTVRPTVQISGIIETHDPTYWQREPALQVSVRCAYPYFKALTSTTVRGKTGNAVAFVYKGTAPTGFVLRSGTALDASGYSVDNDGLDLQVGIANDPFIDKDMFILDTRRGNKSLRRSRNNTTTNILAYLTRGGLSMQVSPLTKSFRVRILGSGKQRSVSLTYTAEYNGI